MFNRAAQGSRSGPSLCAHSLALAMCLALARLRRGAAKTSVYVDDPVMAFIGVIRTRTRNAAVVIGALLATGYPLAFAKAQYAGMEQTVTWTSAKLVVYSRCVDISAKDEITEDV